jgi:hypothetical protein
MRRFVVAVLVASALGACGGGDDAPSTDEAQSPAPSQTQTEAPKPEVRTLPAHVEVVSTGAVAVDYREATDVTVSLFQPGKTEVSLLTVGLAKERRLGSLAFRTAFDLAGQYAGPDRYEIPAVGAAKGATSISNAFLLTAELKDPAGEVVEANVTSSRRFDRALAPCEVVVARGERSGSISCPRLADASGETVDLRMTWKADE